MAISSCLSCESVKGLYSNIFLKVSVADEFFFDYSYFEKKTVFYTKFRDILSDSLKISLTLKKILNNFLWIFGI